MDCDDFCTNDLAVVRYIGTRTLVMLRKNQGKGGLSKTLFTNPCHAYNEVIIISYFAT